MRQRRHVVQYTRAGIKCCRHDIGVPAVDGNDRALRRQRADDRQHARKFFFDAHGFRPRSRRLAPDVDDGSTRLREEGAMGDGTVRVRIVPAIREAVRGDVENAEKMGVIEGDAGKGRTRADEIGREPGDPFCDAPPLRLGPVPDLPKACPPGPRFRRSSGDELDAVKGERPVGQALGRARRPRGPPARTSQQLNGS